jgi:hypothetical protein
MIDRRMFKGTNLFYLLFETIKWELVALDQYIEETAQTLKTKQQKLEDDYEVAKANREPDDPHFDSYFPDEFDRYHKLFPTYTFNSLLVTQFSFLELYFREVCEMYERKSYSKVKLSDLYGSDIEKCKKYLTLIAEMSFVTLEKDWQRIKFIQQLRNSTVHHTSKIENSTSNKSLIAHLKKEKFIDYDDSGDKFFINDVQFLKNFSKIIINFFSHLTTTLAETKVLAKNSSMPYNNDNWGNEKSLHILEEIIACNNLLIQAKETQDPEYLKDRLMHIENTLGRMAWDGTKLFAFFSDAKWETKDRDAIMTQGKEGLEMLKKIYK